jgi:diguanylate cyclase (GGDEF)-like protein
MSTKIDSWISGNPATVQAGESLGVTVRLMREMRVGAILVMEGEKLVGVFTERDLVRLFCEGPADAVDRPIADVMTRNPVCAQRGEDYNSVYLKMQTHGVRHIPVLDGECLVGIVSIRDLIHHYQNRLETEYLDARRRIEELERLANLADDDRLRTLIDEINRYKELSVTDPLTGLYNKRYFVARLTEETARAARYGEKLSLIFCDVDHFKAVNDNYGHGAGDLVLQQVARILAGGMDRFNILSRLRKSDIVARYGGEEFVVILPETGAEGAARAADNVREAVAKQQFRLDGTTGSITMSFGVAAWGSATKSADDLIRNADTALYRAKEKGRNRVETF